MAVGKISLTVPSAQERAVFERGDPVVDPIVRYESGLVIRGPVTDSGQDRRLRVAPGATVSWTGGYGKYGMQANGQVPAPLSLPFHTTIPSISSHRFAAGDRVVIMVPTPVQHNTVYLDDAVLIECESSFPALPALHASWPSTVTGFTDQDVADFLHDTPWWLESREGWSARFAHPDITTPGSGTDAGYGGLMAVITSFGAMLLCSDRSSALKKQVQDRMLMMADDLERFGIRWPANGGHGNGKYILWLIRNAVVGGPTFLTAADFSENQQIYRDGNNQIAWRFNPQGTIDPVYQFCCTINRWMGAAVCAKIATFLGANTSDWVAYTMSYMTTNASISPAWYFSMSPKLATVFAANRVLIGY